MKKILYSIMEKVGGHVSAARALIEIINELKVGPYEHRMIDLGLELRTAWTSIEDYYRFMNERLPLTWKLLWYSTNNPQLIDRLYTVLYPLLYKNKAIEILEREKPDLIVSLVGPTTRGLVRGVRDLGRKIPIVTIVLDPISVHASWVDPGVDCIVVATEEARDICLNFGMPANKIKVIGFPINPRFLLNYGSKEDLRRSFDLDPKIFTALVMSGGVGLGNVRKIARDLNLSNLNIQLIAIAGYNKKLEIKLSHESFRFPVRVFGFTDRVPEIMAASDVMITKAGPGAIYEAIAKELPLIIMSHIPGQEEGNVEYVRKNGIGIIARKRNEIIEAVRKMQTAGTKEYESNMRRIRNPGAVYEIAKLIVSYL